ncbi:hypothetical protein ACXYMU_04275 [Pontibacter sp. CAU 1760]
MLEEETDKLKLIYSLFHTHKMAELLEVQGYGADRKRNERLSSSWT